ncbi:unnamed protein product [Calypogeia fissa]
MTDFVELDGGSSKGKPSYSCTMGAGKMQFALNVVRGTMSDSFGPSSKLLQQSISGKGGGKVGSWEGTRRLYTFCGLLALEVIVVLLLFCNRRILTLHLCRQTPEPRYPPSAWYYEHVYDYPVPILRILTHEDGAPPIRSRILPRERDITIATHTTADRLPAVRMTALRWSGAMAVVVLVRVRSDIPTVYGTLREIYEVVEAEGRCRLHIQVVIEDGFKHDEEALRALYPINSLRNLALRMVTTELFLMIDADLVPSPGLHEHLTQYEDKYDAYLQRATEKKQLLVIPAFQMIQDRNIPYRESLHALPHTKEEMREAWWNGIVDCFQCDVSPGAHTPTDYPRFTNPGVDYPYDATYREGYEPFFVAAVNDFPKYDGRFRGYGKNKASHVFALSAKGMGFTVVPEGFLVELPHVPSFSQKAYSGKDRDPLQQWRTDALYRRFKAELRKELNVTEQPARIYTAEA